MAKAKPKVRNPVEIAHAGGPLVGAVVDAGDPGSRYETKEDFEEELKSEAATSPRHGTGGGMFDGGKPDLQTIEAPKFDRAGKAAA